MSFLTWEIPRDNYNQLGQRFDQGSVLCPLLSETVRDRRGRPTYLGYGQLGIPSVGKNEGNGQRTKKKVKF